MSTPIAILWDRLRTSLWFVPTGMTLVASGLAMLMIAIDHGRTPLDVREIDWIYAGGPEGARQMLSTIAGSMITVAGVAFSITIVALTLASQQFGPRLLRNFMRDVGNQVVLGTYISTFIYCLLVLRTINGNEDSVFVPQLSVTGAVALAIISFGVLIFFIHHVSSSIQVESLVDAVATELREVIDRLYPQTVEREVLELEAEAVGSMDGAQIVRAGMSGYVQMLDDERLYELAVECDLVVRMCVRAGQFVVAGDAIAKIQRSAEAGDRLEQKINDAVIVGRQRTSTQDPLFAVNQLVEIAVRALSPGVNDPFTAATCVDQLSGVLCRLAGRDRPAPFRTDASGVRRLYIDPVTFPDVTRTAFDQIRQHSRDDVAVSMRLLEALERVMGHVQRDVDMREVAIQAQLVVDGLRTSDLVDGDRTKILDRYRSVMKSADEAHGRLSRSYVAQHPDRSSLNE